MGGHFPLEGDGCVPSLFHYMWNKNSRKKSCPMVKVPDTVVYKYRQPAYWYFTSKDPSAGIKMKNKCNPLPPVVLWYACGDLVPKLNLGQPCAAAQHRGQARVRQGP